MESPSPSRRENKKISATSSSEQIPARQQAEATKPSGECAQRDSREWCGKTIASTSSDQFKQ